MHIQSYLGKNAKGLMFVMKRKIRRLGVPVKKPVRISATFRTITVPVPDAPVSEALPSGMTFRIDTRFTSAQVSRIIRMIRLVLLEWQEHQEQVNAGNRSAYQNCVNRYARFNLAPVWFEEKLGNGAAAAAVQMDGFTTQITANGFGRAATAFIMYQVPPSGSNFTIKGANASNPETNSLSITVNPRAISNTGVTDRVLAGSLQHAWLHREGYRHPTGIFTGYMAGEASMCIMRNNSNKPSGSQSGFTRWLD